MDLLDDPDTTDDRNECNVCGSREFKDFHGRTNVMCAVCKSVERTRVLMLHLKGRRELVRPGMRVLHFAPELGIARYIKSIVGDGYRAVDFDPPRYPAELNVQKFDLISDTENLPPNHYDLILHSHVMEHIKCDVTATLFHLHRALSPTGHHLFCIPIVWGHYGADFSNLSAEEAHQRFGQLDHVRRFGREDLDVTVGKVFPLRPAELVSEYGADNLRRYNIPEFAWTGRTGHTFFILKKDEIKLKA